MENKYKIYIYGIGDNNNASYIYLPINPDKIKIVTSSGIETINILGLGERLLVKDRKLQSISWSAFLPPSDGIIQAVADNSSYVADPDSTAKAFKNAIMNRTTCYLLINKINIDGVESVYIERLPVVIEEFETDEEGGLENYIPYTITLKENPSGASSTTQVVAMNTVISASTTTTTTTTDVSLVKETKQEGKSKWAIGDTVYVTANSLFGDKTKGEFTYTKGLFIYKRESLKFKAFPDISFYSKAGVIKEKTTTSNLWLPINYVTYRKADIDAPVTLYRITLNSPVKFYKSQKLSGDNVSLMYIGSVMKIENSETNQFRYYEELKEIWCPEECLAQ